MGRDSAFAALPLARPTARVRSVAEPRKDSQSPPLSEYGISRVAKGAASRTRSQHAPHRFHRGVFSGRFERARGSRPVDACAPTARTKTPGPSINIEVAGSGRLRDVATNRLGMHGREGAIRHAPRGARSRCRTWPAGSHREATVQSLGRTLRVPSNRATSESKAQSVLKAG